MTNMERGHIRTSNQSRLPQRQKTTGEEINAGSHAYYIIFLLNPENT